MEFKYQLGQLVKHVSSRRFGVNAFTILGRAKYEERAMDGSVNTYNLYRLRSEISNLVEWVETEILPLTDKEQEMFQQEQITNTP